MIQNIIYISKADKELSKFEVKELVFFARVKNREEKITGFLIHQNGYFIQWIEGPSENVLHLLEKIKQDSRHQSLKVLVNRKLESPVYNNWRMRYLTDVEKLKIGDFEDLYSESGGKNIVDILNRIMLDFVA